MEAIKDLSGRSDNPMKTITKRNGFWQPAFFVAAFSFCTGNALAQLPPGAGIAPTNRPLASWSFRDQMTWTNDQGYLPVSFTNLNFSWLGDGASLVVDTNLPAWLNFNVVEPSTGATNLILNASGSLTFWFAPEWATTNGGPGEWSQLVDIGGWTTNASFGYWGLTIDPSGSNLWFLAQDGAGSSYGLSTPICWTTNYFHYVVLSYSSTNLSLYLDGQLSTNDAGGLNVWPSSTAVAGGIYFGSDTNGFSQAAGLFNSIQTYSYQLSSNDVQSIFSWNYGYYMMDPFNWAMGNVISAPSSPSSSPTPDVITGQGDLLILMPNVNPCISTTTNNVWFTNVTAVAAADGTMGITFTIEGGLPNVPYDVFANSVLSFGTNGLPWAWMGQGYQCNTYMLTNLPNTSCFLILGGPQDTDGDGLTDAYELLVSKTDPNNAYSNLDGISDGWEILLGLNPTVSNFISPSERSNYGYTPADWLNTVSGVKTGTISTDNEGNVQSVSQ